MEQTIAFVSLFLGLVLGPQSVEVAVAPEVVRVELHLDGEQVGVLQGEPWRMEVDLGERLLPHRLEAVAFDAGDEEVGRIAQWLNLPRPAAEARFVLERATDGSTVARLTWRSLTAAEPDRIAVFFDGRPLAFDDPEAIVLPPHDPEVLHFLRAELDFADNVSTVAEASFGGFYADRVESELTAVPLLSQEAALSSPDELEGLLLHGGEPARVVALDAPSADVMVVRDPSAIPILSRMLGRELRVRAKGRAPLSAVKLIAPLGSDVQTEFLWPFAERRVQEEQVVRLFPGTPVLDERYGGWLWLLSQVRQPAYPPGEQRLVDAVAVAGLNAARGNRARAVLLVLGPEPLDNSQLGLETVRGYLSTIGVPLHVWRVSQRDRDAERSSGDWREDRVIDSTRDLNRAAGDLRRELGRQRIAWLDGRFLPQQIELVEGRGVARVR